MGYKSALVFFFFFSSLAFSQTFTVLNETSGNSGISTIDGTTEFRFSVQLTGASGNLTNVVPELVPPTCAQQGGQPIFNTTYMGIVGGSQSQLAIPTWANNQTRQLIFRVHLFNNSVTCNSAGSCGGSDFDFQLRFTHANRTTPISATDPSRHLEIDSPRADGYRIVATVSETSPEDCDFYVGLALPSVNYSGVPGSLLNDPDIRVFIGIDWNLNINNNPNPNITFATGLDSFLYPTGSGVNEFFRLKESNLNGGNPLAPFIPQDTVIRNQVGQQIPLGPLGGDGPLQQQGDCTLQTWNFFDITDLRPETQAAPPIINHLNNPRAGLFENTVRLNPANNGASFRKAGLYLVRPDGCNANTAFGSPPTQIQFEEYHLTANGQAQVRLSLPAAWTTAGGTRLRNNFTLEWFFRNHRVLTKATLPGGGATNSRNLNTTLAIPFNAPSDFVIEARIRHVSTNAMISFQSPKHDLNYAELGLQSFENAEFNLQTGNPDPDSFLDPGEILVQELRIENMGSFADNVSISAGKITPLSAELAFSGREKTTFLAGSGANQQVFQEDIASGGSLELDLLYELLTVEGACEDLTLFFEVAYENQGMATSFRREFTLETNCGTGEHSFDLDGQWVDHQNAGSPPCNGSNCNGSSVSSQSPTAGWGFTNPAWVGSTQTRDVFYTLTSPADGFPIGTGDKIAMRHQATFPQQDGGAIVEYRTSNNGGPWTNWQDLITPLETQNSTNLYHPQRFTTTVAGVDNVLGNRDVFMNMASQQNFDLPLSAATLSGDRVQFRFLYHLVRDPDHGGSSSPGLWQIADFAYKTTLTQFDDIFGLGQNLAFSSCFPTIQLNPEPAGNYVYSWYIDFRSLLEDQAHTTSTDGHWDFPVPASPRNYYVKVERQNSGTVRYYPLQISSSSSVVPLSVVLSAWNTPGVPGTSDINSSGQVDIIDAVLQIILESCP